MSKIAVATEEGNQPFYSSNPLFSFILQLTAVLFTFSLCYQITTFPLALTASIVTLYKIRESRRVWLHKAEKREVRVRQAFAHASQAVWGGDTKHQERL